MIAEVWMLLSTLMYSLQINTGTFPKPLTEAEERHYLTLAKQGDLDARNVLIERNLRLVAHITGGIISMSTLMLKGVFSLMASFLLIATTSIDALCAGLRKLHVPGILTTLLLLTYRYIGLMIEQVAIMSESYCLRAPNQTGIHFSAWGSFLGQLLLRSQDRAQELYESMLLRGFTGEFYYVQIRNAQIKDYLFCLGSFALFIAVRLNNFPELLGSILTR